MLLPMGVEGCPAGCGAPFGASSRLMPCAGLVQAPGLFASMPWCLQGDLDDRALALLVDVEMPLLDLAGAQRLTLQGVASVLPGMPALRAADLAFPGFQPSLVATLQRSCPQLEVLRLDGMGPPRGAGTFNALVQALPRLRHREAVGDSWEDIAQEDAGEQVRL